MGQWCRIMNEVGMAPPEAGVLKAYNFTEIGDDELEVNMYGEVVETVPVNWWTGKKVEGLYICVKEFLDDLEKYKQKSKITVRINSPGGDLYAGLAIANRMKELDAEVITVADALCASAAVAIFQAGNTRKVYKGSQIMIHEPSCYIYGRYDVQGIKKVEKQLEAGKKSLVAAYEERTGREKTDLERMITEDSWMTGQEAIDEKFADEMIEGEVSAGVTEDKKTVISNGISFPASAFFSMPLNLQIVKKVDSGKEPATIANQQKGGKGKMNKQELMENEPGLYNEILSEGKSGQDEAVRAAVEAERNRIREIDEIANSIGDAEMVENAKFGENPMDAKTLAFEAMKRQSQIGNGFLEGMKKDTENSGVNGVKPAPNSGTKSKEEKMQDDIRNGAALIAGIAQEGEQK